MLSATFLLFLLFHLSLVSARNQEMVSDDIWGKQEEIFYPTSDEEYRRPKRITSDIRGRANVRISAVIFITLLALQIIYYLYFNSGDLTIVPCGTIPFIYRSPNDGKYYQGEIGFDVTSPCSCRASFVEETRKFCIECALTKMGEFRSAGGVFYIRHNGCRTSKVALGVKHFSPSPHDYVTGECGIPLYTNNYAISM